MDSEQPPVTAQKTPGDFAPKLAQLTDEVLFGDVWERPELSKRDRSHNPYPESLCWRCAHHRVVNGARSVFVMCSALAVRYPRQPVAACPAFEPPPPPPAR